MVQLSSSHDSRGVKPPIIYTNPYHNNARYRVRVDLESASARDVCRKRAHRDLTDTKHNRRQSRGLGRNSDSHKNIGLANLAVATRSNRNSGFRLCY